MTGKYLGELGKTKAPREDTFGWFGETIRVGDGGSDLKLLDFLEHADDVSDNDQREQLRLIKDFLHSLVHEDDFDTFWRLALDNNQGLEDLMQVLIAITEGTTNRPTRRRSGSSAGRRATGAKSRPSSSLPNTSASPLARRRWAASRTPTSCCTPTTGRPRRF